MPTPLLCRRLLATLFTLVAWAAARADVTLATPFTDHAVLQHGKPVPVWGRAEPGEKVALTFAGQTVHATADHRGRWIVFLAPLAPTATPGELTATGNNTVTLTDIVVGEVWLCSGQSNMEWPLARTANAATEIASAHQPLIRHLKIKRVGAETPADSTEGAWVVCDPSTAGDFTAVGYFFARELAQKLRLPVGLINATWGGTPVESWLSPAALASDPAFEVVRTRWAANLSAYPEAQARFEAANAAWQRDEAAAKANKLKFTTPRPRAPRGPGDPWTPGSLFNGMISPLLPYALRGALWYQGESNADRPLEYHRLFTAMITHWRSHFGQGDFPFYWVQLPNFKNPGDAGGLSWAQLREAQARTLALPATGMAVTIDVGDPDDIHPTEKREVGRRLALIARVQLHGVPGDFSGPLFERATPEGAALRVRFTHAGTGLIARDRPLQSFQIAGVDRKFHPASARIDRETLIVSAPEVPRPVAVRYAWSNNPSANLYNGAGLPAAPFRSDDW